MDEIRTDYFTSLLQTKSFLYIISLKTPALIMSCGKFLYARFEVFTAVTMKNAIFWDVTSCGFCENWCFGGMYHLHHQGDKNLRARNNVSSK
jgi:hypothetical protein